jgi:hypothetical protein
MFTFITFLFLFIAAIVGFVIGCLTGYDVRMTEEKWAKQKKYAEDVDPDLG